jgi:hypothetical protein
MSIAQLAYSPQITLQNASFESSTPTSNGTYSNINQSNDLIPGLSGVPNATFTTGIGASDDPDIPNSMLISCALNNPVTPSIPILQLSPTGGSGAGSGAICAIAGDALIAGTLTMPDLAGTGSFTAVGVDSNGLFKTNTTQGYVGKTNGSLAVSGIFQNITDNSWINYNLSSGVCQIYFNINGKVSASSGTNNNLFAIQNISGSVPIPEISADYVQGAPTSNFITMYSYLNNGTYPTNSVAGLAYLIQGTSAINVYMSPSINFSAGDDVQFIGSVSYPIASLV